MQVLDDDCCKGERCRTALLATPSFSSSSSTSQAPVIAVNMQHSRVTGPGSYIRYHDADANEEESGQFFGSNYHLQINRHSINIALRVAAAFVLLCIAGCLTLQHLRINRLEYRIRRLEVTSTYSVQVCS
ncbi:unnamed protein product [Gongylonema pulchrum]|uniref:Conserved plasma membrane protein n=1 Tax=Gongylonema pulchrum TaxID=637853 RepID=A0A183DAX8_9BILA|nr:unnamed protein product [Gongylonema pulchrum]